VALALNLAMSERVTLGPPWVLPSIGALLLVALVAIAPARATRHAVRVRRLAASVIGVVSLANVVSLGLLVHFLISGGQTGGHRLILSGALLWANNVLLFAVWYWEIDRGGPVARFLHGDALPDFQFPQMENPQFAPLGWRPGFVDYLYLSLPTQPRSAPRTRCPSPRPRSSRWASSPSQRCSPSHSSSRAPSTSSAEHRYDVRGGAVARPRSTLCARLDR
jgi:hypothetical protein